MGTEEGEGTTSPCLLRPLGGVAAIVPRPIPTLPHTYTLEATEIDVAAARGARGEERAPTAYLISFRFIAFRGLCVYMFYACGTRAHAHRTPTPHAHAHARTLSFYGRNVEKIENGVWRKEKKERQTMDDVSLFPVQNASMHINFINTRVHHLSFFRLLRCLRSHTLLSTLNPRKKEREVRSVSVSAAFEMEGGRIVIVGTFDTKAEEHAHLRQLIQQVL
jgi:hypothetical protein